MIYIKQCLICFKDYELLQKSHINRSKYCSKICFYKSKVGKSPANKNKILKECLICKKKYEVNFTQNKTNKYCSVKCKVENQKGKLPKFTPFVKGRISPFKGIGPSLIELYEKYVIKNESGCWNWSGNKDKNGYGNFFYRGKAIRAHRASWIINNKEIPNGLFVLHHCDNPPCTKIDHLWVGNSLDNNHDMIKKGRNRNGRKKINNK